MLDKVFEPVLFQCKGERYPRIFSVPMVADSVNEGDVFILDMNKKIYMWPGKDCNVNEKMKALEIITNIAKFERHLDCEICFPLEDAKIDEEFWGHLGGKPAVIKPATPDNENDPEGDDLKYSFYKISNDTGKLQCIEIKERPLMRTHLDTNDTFVLEVHKSVMIWIGKQANVEEKKNALIIGKSFVKAHNKPKGTRVSRIVENAEDAYFRSFFNGFYPIAQVNVGDPNVE